ncbi:2-oxoacid:acceptor oxidoreductase family protein [bacterium]|nr:2-oxoacid:acceptor oxidoreductase family protein [bacterium]
MISAPGRTWHVCPFTGLPVEITEVRVNGPRGVSVQYRCLTRIDACQPGVCPLFPEEGQIVPKSGPYELPYRSDRGICSILMSGLGGDGANTAAKLLFDVAVNQIGLDGGLDAKYGSEKTGTPTDVSIRLTDTQSPIRTSGPTRMPHILVVFHPELVRPLRLTEGLRENASVIVNTTRPFDEIRDLLELHSGTLHLLDAAGIARATRSRLNMPLLAQLCRVIGFPDEALEEPIVKKWPRQSEANLAAFRAARDGVQTRRIDPDGRYALRPPRPIQSRIGYETMLDGGTVRAADSLIVPKPGSRRSLSPPPAFNRAACIDCVLCLTVCPDPGALIWRENKMTGVDAAYCKACMRCVSVCPETKKGKALTAP